MADYPHMLKLKTARYVSSLQDWLYRNCEGRFEIRIDEVSEELEIKRYLFLFECRSDLDGFKWALVRPGMPDRLRPMPHMGAVAASAGTAAGSGIALSP